MADVLLVGAVIVGSVIAGSLRSSNKKQGRRKRNVHLTPPAIIHPHVDHYKLYQSPFRYAFNVRRRCVTMLN